MHEYKEKTKKLCDMKDKIYEMTQMYLATTSVDNICVQTLGELIDMIKDMTEAEEKVWKACYYKTVIEAMEEAEEEDDEPNYRIRMSSRRGYVPMGDMTFDGMDHMMDRDLSSSDHRAWNAASRYGKPYNDYQMAKRHYTESHDQHDRDEMDTKAVEHMADMIATMKEIWNDATPALKKQMAADLKGMTNGMTM